MSSSATTPRVSIVGSGFGALTSIRELRRLRSDAEITVIAPRAELHYLPGSIWIPSGLRRREDLVVPLAAFFHRMRVRHVMTEAIALSVDGRRLTTGAGEVDNDALLIACGARFIKRLPGIEHVITPCEGIAAAEQFRDRLRSMHEGVIAVGFGANPLEPSAVLARMRRCGIETHLGHKLLRFEAHHVVTEHAAFGADLILFMPGLTGPAWLERTPLPRSPGGMIQADGHCRVGGFERVYVVGDAGSFPGPDWMPKQAHMADLQALAAARNLIEEFAGRPARHGFKVEMMCIIDDLVAGTLVLRNVKRTVVLPRSRLWHWAKRGFERKYLRQYR